MDNLSKICGACGTEKSLEEFPLRNGKPISRCRLCRNEQAKGYYETWARKVGRAKGQGHRNVYQVEKPEKLCTMCGLTLPAAKFYKYTRHSDGYTYLSAYCKACNIKRKQGWHSQHPERVIANNKARNVALRLEVMTAYGGKCVCCGESGIDFLSIDHINNDGAKHRRSVGCSGGGTFYRWLQKQGYPKEDFQILCYNCNLAKAHCGGVCPHQRGK